jgi:IS1 family transposase
MNKLNKDKRAAVLASLVEGNSIRSTVRMTGVAKNTVTKLLVEAGAACATYQDKVLRDLQCKKIQCDEIWAYCYAKDKNVPKDKRGPFGFGDVWTWTAIDPDSKLVVTWLVGLRNLEWATAFMKDVQKRLANRVQLTTDGHKVYFEAVDEAFGADVDYAMLVKLYGKESAGEARYSPPKCIGCRRQKLMGNPDPKDISTSMAERQNLTMRMSMRRFTRLTNAFSKKIGNLEAAVALHFMHYNFVRIHQTLRVSPAMAAGVTDHLWEISDIINLLNKSN